MLVLMIEHLTSLLMLKSSNDQFLPNRGKNEYLGGMGLLGLVLIENLCCQIFVWGDMGLILEVKVENRHVGKFGEFGQIRGTTWRFAKAPHIAFNFMI